MVKLMERSEYAGGSIVLFEKGADIKVIRESHSIEFESEEESAKFVTANFQPIRDLLMKDRSAAFKV